MTFGSFKTWELMVEGFFASNPWGTFLGIWQLSLLGTSNSRAREYLHRPEATGKSASGSELVAGAALV